MEPVHLIHLRHRLSLGKLQRTLTQPLLQNVLMQREAELLTNNMGGIIL